MRRRWLIGLSIASALLLLVYAGLWLLMPGYGARSAAAWRGLLARAQPEDVLRPAGKVLHRHGRRLLWGGVSDEAHFDITTFRLDPENLHHGLGRERFPALIEPEFQTVAQAAPGRIDADRVLLVKIGQEVKVYPIATLLRHEVVNDVVGGRPVFVAYCILADLGAVYDRSMDGHAFTFAVSGYTYADESVWDGRPAFVLWDRDTESLWWPPLGKAVSGPMIDRRLALLDETLWSQTTWGQVKRAYPDALVLRPGQTLAPPRDWPVYTVRAPVRAPTTTAPAGAIAPRWGQNAQLAAPREDQQPEPKESSSTQPASP